MKGLRAFLFVILAVLSTGFFWGGSHQLPKEGDPKIPHDMPSPDIMQSPYYTRLINSYGNGIVHERIKIDYLFHEIKKMKYSFIRNGITYNARKTAKHLRKKYKERIRTVNSAKDFIEKIASFSSVSGKPYIVKPEGKHVYYSKDLLYYELDRLEAFLKLEYKKKMSKEAA